MREEPYLYILLISQTITLILLIYAIFKYTKVKKQIKSSPYPQLPEIASILTDLKSNGYSLIRLDSNNFFMRSPK